MNKSEVYMETWSDLLQCNWSKVEVTGNGSIELTLPSHNATDMSGCIFFCKALMPEVKDIIVVEGEEVDIVYRYKNGDWMAYLPRK